MTGGAGVTGVKRVVRSALVGRDARADVFALGGGVGCLFVLCGGSGVEEDEGGADAERGARPSPVLRRGGLRPGRPTGAGRCGCSAGRTTRCVTTRSPGRRRLEARGAAERVRLATGGHRLADYATPE